MLKLVVNPDDEYLSDVVPSEAHRSQFPGGVIPHRDAVWLLPHLKRTEDLFKALEDMLYTHDLVTDTLGHESVSSLFEMIDAYNLIPKADLVKRKEAIKGLLGQTMPIRFMLGLIGERDGSSILHLFTGSGHGTYDDARIEAMLDADERIVKGEGHTQVMKATGLASRTITSLENVRDKAIDVGYEGALRHAFFLMMSGVTPLLAWRAVLTQHHDVAAEISYNTVYSLRRTDRFVRNVKRFGWLPHEDTGNNESPVVPA